MEEAIEIDKREDNFSKYDIKTIPRVRDFIIAPDGNIREAWTNETLVSVLPLRMPHRNMGETFGDCNF